VVSEPKEMDKMKKLLVLLVLAVVMCRPDLACAEPQKPFDEGLPSDVVKLGYIVQDLEKAAQQLEIITQDLRDIGLELEDDSSWLVFVKLSLEEAYITQGDCANLLRWYWCIKEQCVESWRAEAAFRLKRGKANTDVRLDVIKKSYGMIKTPAAFHIIDKARDILRSTLPLYDRAIQILESNKP
jgi:hypothetical protein